MRVDPMAKWHERVPTTFTSASDCERRIVAGMTVEDIATEMNVPIIFRDDYEITNRIPSDSRVIGRPPAYASLAYDVHGSTVIICEARKITVLPGFSELEIRGVSDVLHELSHLMHEHSFVDESSVAAWQALAITYIEPMTAAELASDMEEYAYSWSGGGRRGSVRDFDAWLHSPEFEELRQFAEQLGIVRGHEPLLRRVNP